MGFKILNLNIFFGGGNGIEDFVDSLWRSSQNWTISGSFLCILRYFLKVQNGNSFGGGGGVQSISPFAKCKSVLARDFFTRL